MGVCLTSLRVLWTWRWSSSFSFQSVLQGWSDRPIVAGCESVVTLPALSQTWIMLILLMDVICRWSQTAKGFQFGLSEWRAVIFHYDSGKGRAPPGRRTWARHIGRSELRCIGHLTRLVDQVFWACPTIKRHEWGEVGDDSFNTSLSSTSLLPWKRRPHLGGLFSGAASESKVWQH